MAKRTPNPTRWRSPNSLPPRDGWYEVLAPDNRWEGQPNWRLWRRGSWWKECENQQFVAYVNETRYRWRGIGLPVYLRYSQVSGRKGETCA